LEEEEDEWDTRYTRPTLETRRDIRDALVDSFAQLYAVSSHCCRSTDWVFPTIIDDEDKKGLIIEALASKIARLLRNIRDLAMRIFQKLQGVTFGFFAAVWRK